VKQFAAVVLDIREERRVAGKVRWQVLLDQTQFAAGDVGSLEAVARSGARLEIPVLAVESGGAGEIWHVVEKPLAAGTEIVGRVAARV
jgi:hypothetical protein